MITLALYDATTLAIGERYLQEAQAEGLVERHDTSGTPWAIWIGGTSMYAAPNEVPTLVRGLRLLRKALVP